jgi:hypothetical protein
MSIIVQHTVLLSEYWTASKVEREGAPAAVEFIDSEGILQFTVPLDLVYQGHTFILSQGEALKRLYEDTRKKFLVMGVNRGRADSARELRELLGIDQLIKEITEACGK